jgi:Peptidase family M23
MPPPRARLLLLVVTALALAALALAVPRPAGAAGAAARWRWPLHGSLVGSFHYAPRHPFAAGRRRGIDIAAAPGAVVRSACRGRVTFAGPLPGAGGRGVTVRCGALVATHLGLGRVTVRRGVRVGTGTRLGRVGPRGRLRLGARRRGDRFGYVDPLALLGADPPVGPSVPVAPLPPLGRAPRVPVDVAPRAVPRPRLAPRVRLAPRPGAVAAPRLGAPGIPRGAWAGLVLLAAGLPLGGLVRVGRRRRGRRAVATAVTGR